MYNHRKLVQVSFILDCKKFNVLERMIRLSETNYKMHFYIEINSILCS